MIRRLVAAGAVLVLLGFLLAASGIVPVKASSGHWPPTEWLLQFAKRRSIATWSLPIEAPRLDDPALVVKGASQFDVGCRPCHGSPGLYQPRIAWRMLPHPPDLSVIARKFSAEELFFIVKHGLKLTGMPAWPVSSRDDEVWSMVAFLRVLPELDIESYRLLSRGETALTIEDGDPQALEDLVPPSAPPLAVAESCARCHGFRGGARGDGAFPRIDGQRRDYLYRALEAYADRSRPSGNMGPIAAGLEPSAWVELADYYTARSDHSGGEARRAAAIANAAPTAAAREHGASIAARGVPERKVPACQECHGPEGPPRNPAYPILAGQYAEYLELQLRLFRAGGRGGSSYAHLMQKVAPRLTDEQIEAVALYYASLDPPAGR